MKVAFPSFCHIGKGAFYSRLGVLGLLLSAVLTGSIHSSSEYLLKPGRFAKHVDATLEQSAVLVSWVDSLREAISDHQWEYGKRTNEGRLWQGFTPDIKTLRELGQTTQRRMNSYLDSIRIVLNEKQVARLDQILKENNLLNYPVADVPFYHINNSPLNLRFDDKASAYRVNFPGEVSAAANWSYVDLLETWTVNKYVRLPESVSQQTLTTFSDVVVTAESPSLSSLILRSPLILAATMMVPDLRKAEFDVLFNNYSHTFRNRESAWSSYVAENGSDKYIVIRLKMTTPLSEYYLSPDRYIIYLEDSEGTGYEPEKIDKNPILKLEDIELQTPGKTATYTDVFGTYTGTPGYKQTRTISQPGKINYTGRERLLKLYFPSKNFEGTPIVSNKTRRLKLVVQPEFENLPRVEVMWEMKKKPRAQK